MADALGVGGNRMTFTRTTGHQIRLIEDRVHRGVRVTCICQDARTSPWGSVSPYDVPDHWIRYNQLPHDPAAGAFEPVDVITGAPRAEPAAAAP